jgi:hypothetical protein
MGCMVSCIPLLIAWIPNFDREDRAYTQACYDEDSSMKGQRRFGLFGLPMRTSQRSILVRSLWWRLLMDLVVGSLLLFRIRLLRSLPFAKHAGHGKLTKEFSQGFGRDRSAILRDRIRGMLIEMVVETSTTPSSLQPRNSKRS